MLYRNKPFVIEAFQWMGETDLKGPEWIVEALKTGRVYICGKDEKQEGRYVDEVEGMHIETTAGAIIKADLGDYIIRSLIGEIYPCKPDIFEDSYEKVEKELTCQERRNKLWETDQGH